MLIAPEQTTLRVLRQIRGLSARALAEAAGVHLITVQRVEAGRSAGTVETRAAIARALGVNPADLFEGDTDGGA